MSAMSELDLTLRTPGTRVRIRGNTLYAGATGTVVRDFVAPPDALPDDLTFDVWVAVDTRRGAAKVPYDLSDLQAL